TYSYYSKADGEIQDPALFRGSQGDLMSVVVTDASGAVVDFWHYRYVPKQEPRDPSRLKQVVDLRGYARAGGSQVVIEAMQNAQLAAFVAESFAYDAVGRLSTHALRGAGASSSANKEGGGAWRPGD